MICDLKFIDFDYKLNNDEVTEEDVDITLKRIQWLFDNFNFDKTTKESNLNNKIISLTNEDFSYTSVWRKYMIIKLKELNIDWYSYLCYVHDYKELPKCPICGNIRKIDWSNCYTGFRKGCDFKITCSRSCQVRKQLKDETHSMVKLLNSGSSLSKLTSEKGTHHWFHHNLEFDELGRSIMHVKIAETAIKNETHPWLSKNWKRDSDGKSIHHKLLNEERIENGNHPWKYNGDPEHDKIVKERAREASKKAINTYNSYPGNIASSYPEELLANILFKLNIDYIRNYKVRKETGYFYYVDFYLPEFYIFLECDGMFKWIDNPETDYLLDHYYNRKIYIQNKTNIPVINIPSDDIFYYDKHKRDLYKLIKQKQIKYEIVKYN